jgi:hypothetical protein
MTTSKLTEIASQRSQADMNLLSRESTKWLQNIISEIRNPRTIANQMVRERSRQTSSIKIGKLYSFYYDPKTKDDLPYYDVFPLVLVLETYPDGFLGLNLHYLPYQYRVAFLNKLLQYAVLKNDDEIMRLRVSYDILSASRRFKEFRPCIKKYLYGQLQSKVLTILPNEWEVASLLPVQQFRKAKTQTVWAESMKEIRNI